MNLQIKSDVFDIVDRLKEIDKDYFVVFSLAKSKFELHHATQPMTTYCLTFPFDCLDERCVDLTLKTRRQNKEELIGEMERENEKLTKEKINNLKRRLYGS